ncbi:MAG TPA: hypothetical protein VIH74_00630 [Candidatus Acidoferrum sp.]
MANRASNHANQKPGSGNANRKPEQKYGDRDDNEMIMDVYVESERAEKQIRASDDSN